jgi:hypothetical protein
MKDRFENFKKKSEEKFKGKFDYSKFVYINAKTKGIIVCPFHGEFIQTPDKHLSKDSNGCQICWEEKRKIINRDYVSKDIINPDFFLSRANKKYDNKYGYILDDYNGITGNDIIVICPEHGEFKIKPHNHLLKNNKYGCKLCANKFRTLNKTQKFEDLVKDLSLKYENKYEYSQIEGKEYINKKSKIIIKCPSHGDFIKTAQKHLLGQDCFKCKIEKLVNTGVLVGGYSFELFEKNPDLKRKDSYLYYLEINDGELYKIGITINDVKNRIKSIKSKSNGHIKKIKLLFSEKMSLFDSFKIENNILTEHNEFRVFTKWSTELFNYNILNK